MALSWPSAGICLKVRKVTVPEKAFVRIKPSNFADSASAVFDILRIFYGNTEDTVKVDS